MLLLLYTSIMALKNPLVGGQCALCQLSTGQLDCLNTLRQFLTNSKLLIWLTTHARQSTRRHSVFCLPLKEQSHKDLLILRMIRHDTQLIDHNHYRSNTLPLRH